MEKFSLGVRLLCEFTGTAVFLLGVVGSSITVSLVAADGGVALMSGAATAAITLGLMIAVFGAVSGGHFNPGVSLAFMMRGALPRAEWAGYAVAQIAGGIAGVVIAHLLFGEALLQISTTARGGLRLGLSELVASFLLTFVILAGARFNPSAVPILVAGYVFAASWFTPSGAFANPALTLARMLTDAPSGIAPGNVPLFVTAQLAGCALAACVMSGLPGTGKK